MSVTTERMEIMVRSVICSISVIGILFVIACSDQNGDDATSSREVLSTSTTGTTDVKVAVQADEQLFSFNDPCLMIQGGPLFQFTCSIEKSYENEKIKFFIVQSPSNTLSVNFVKGEKLWQVNLPLDENTATL
jgi:hypothetical protein